MAIEYELFSFGGSKYKDQVTGDRILYQISCNPAAARMQREISEKKDALILFKFAFRKCYLVECERIRDGHMVLRIIRELGHEKSVYSNLGVSSLPSLSFHVDGVRKFSTPLSTSFSTVRTLKFPSP